MIFVTFKTSIVYIYLGILNGLENLAKEGKISIQDKIVSIACVTVLGEGESREITVWELLKREKEIEEKKEIMRMYKHITKLA